MGVKTDFTTAEIRILVGILNARNSPSLNLATLARMIGTNPANPPYISVVKYLLNAGILEQVGTIGSSKIIKIHHRPLCDLLDEQNLVTFLVDNYIARWHLFSWKPIW